MADRRLEVTISADSSKFISELKKAGVQVKSFDDDTKGASKGTASFGDAMNLLGGPSLTLAAGLAAVAGGIKFTTDAARESREVQAQLAAVLKSTGGIAGVTSAEANAYANSLQKLTNFDDEAILSGETLLLTFKKIGGDIFPRATAAALDLSVRFKQDLSASVTMLGKALENPIAGISALTRNGITFTDAQKDMIESLVESGDLLGAQAIILTEVEANAKGAAEAARLADGGFIAVQNSAGNLAEAVGEALMPAMTSLNEIVIAGLDGLTMAYEYMSILADASSILAERGQSLGTVWLDTLFNQESLAGAVQEVTAAQAEQAAGLANNTDAIVANAEAVAAQEEILRANQQVTADYYSNIFEMQDERVKSEQDANLKIAQSQSDADAAMAANTQTLNERIAELNNERIDAKNEVAARGAEMTDGEYEAEMIKINTHYDEMIVKTNEAYTEQNGEIQAKLKERQLAIEEQQRKEQEEYEKHLLDINLKTSLNILERKGKLEELTGIVGATADEVFDLIKGGQIKAEGELLGAISGEFQGFNQNIGDARQVAETSIGSLKGVFDGTFTGITDSNNTMKDRLITNFRDIESAARSAATIGNGLSITGSATAANYATGGTFTVPPGYPNDSYRMGVSTGETVTVQNNYNLTTQTAMDSAGVSRDFQFMQLFA
jgi:hypothetical protein